ncbi:MAG: fimbrillin family protein, partial [Alistipes senegalensis]|nr:fimbrillin family protein [Bacteroides cellulosilyticus]MCM1353002.1 fimbrillin family protein [Alistipes senegalensis]
CSKSDVETRPVVAGDVEIQATSNARAIDSRAPFVGGIAADNTLTAYVLASTEKGKYLDGDASWWGAGNVEFSDNTTAFGFTPKLYYPAVATQEVHLFGLYPTDAATPGDGWTIDATGATATYAIDGKSDIMTAETATTKKSDVQATTKDYPKLTFKHLLTQYDVKVVAEADADITDDADQPAIKAWGAITKIELVKELNEVDPKNSCKVTFADNTVAFDGAQAIPFYLASGAAGSEVYEDVVVGGTRDGEADPTNVTLTTTESLAAYALVAPISPASGSDVIKLKVYTENEPDGVEVSVSLKKDASTPVTGPTAGQKFTIKLTFKAIEMQVVGDVVAWVDGGTGEQEID